MKCILHSSRLLTFCFFLFSISIHAQSDTLINPNKEGGFELGNGSFVANGWSVAADNAAQVNQWTASWGAQLGFGGTYCAYITNQPSGTPPRHQFTPFQNSTLHFYRDVTFPAGAAQMYLAFSCLNPNYQAPVRVALVHRDSALTTGVTLGTYGGFNSYYYFGVSLDRTIVGNCYRDTTWRLVFSWTEPSSGTINQPSPAIDNIILYAHKPTNLLRGTDSVFTIDKTRPTAGTNFKSIKEAIAALNEYPLLCIPQRKIVFNVAAGQIFEDINPQITISGTENAPIIFQKSGVGTNPVIKPKIVNYNEANGLMINGGDYLTFDGVDIDGRNDSLNTYLMLTGLVLYNGASNNTFKNANITLDMRTLRYTWTTPMGIAHSRSQNFDVSNSKNRYLNLNIQNCRLGINIESNSSAPDSNIEIGSTDPQRLMTIEVPDGENIGNAAIMMSAQNIDLHHIKSNLPFILNYMKGYNRIYHNKMIVPNANHALTFYSSGSDSDSMNIDVFNNFFSLPKSTFRERSGYEMIPAKIVAYGANSTINFYNNSIYLDATLTKTYLTISSCLNYEIRGGRANIFNNIFYNASQNSSVNKSQYCIANANLVGSSSINYNAFWRKDTISKIGATMDYFTGQKTEFSSLVNWQTALQQDINSVETDPVFYSPTDLHAYGRGIDGAGITPPNGLTIDIDNEPRTAPFDIGADQFTRQPTDLAILDLLEPNDSTLILCDNNVRKIKVLVKNVGTQTLDFAQNALTAKVILSRPVGKDTFSTTISTGTLGVDSTKIVEFNTFTPNNTGVYAFATSITTVGDANRQNDSAVYERRLLAAKPLPFVEGFDNTQAFTDWTLSSTVSLQYRGKTGYSLSLSIPSVTQPSPEFKLPKIGKIDTSSLFNVDYRIVTYQNKIVPNSPSWGKIEIFGSTDCGMNFTKIKTIDSTNHRASADFQSIQLPLSTYAGKELVLKFVITSPLVNQVYIDFDNFYIGAPCRALTGVDTIVAPPTLQCIGSSGSIALLNYNNLLLGATRQWQHSTDSLNWVNSSTIDSRFLPVTARNYPIFYRLKTTCTFDSSSRLSNTALIKPAKLLAVASVPYKESFENWQTGNCTTTPYTNDVPTNAWLGQPYSYSNSWRRYDEGEKASWQSPTLGAFSPQSTAGQYSARFHSFGQYSNSKGTLDLNINLSGATDKQIAFDYINTDGFDALQVSLSSDGGITFSPLDTPLSNTQSWQRFKYTIPANGSATSVLRFEGNSNVSSTWQSNTSDIGLDSLTIESITTVPNCTVLTSPQNGATNAQDDQLFIWQPADYATGYRIKIGTTANGSDVLPLTDIGNIRQYRSPNFFDYLKKYYVTLEPYNKIGTAIGCPTSSFTTGKNPNFGGGRDGVDSLQPLSGGYTFANSTNFAANAPIGKAVYNWIDVNESEVKPFVNTVPTGGYLYINTLFRFPFYSGNTSGNTLLIGSNGAIAFYNGYLDYNINKTIPSSISPSDGLIAPCYAPLYRGNDSKIYIKNDSSQFVATWWHFYPSNSGVQDTSEYITFQVILKPDGSIKFQYNANESNVGRLTNSKIQQNAIIGIEGRSVDYSGQRGIQYRNKGRGARLFDAQNKPLAIDFQAPKGDLAIYSLTTPNESSRCLSDVYPTIYVHNTSIGTMDFARTPATLTLKVTGARNETLIHKIDTGYLRFNANMEVRIPTPLSMDTPGTYNFEITIKNDLDENPTNDVVRTVRTIEGSSVSLPFLEDFNTITQVSGGNGGGFYQSLSGWSLSTYQSPTMRLRKGDFLAFDYRLLTYVNYQPQTALLASDWDKIQIGYTTSCGYDFQVLDSITPASHTSTLYWRQKTLRIPDSLEGKLVQIQIQFFKQGSNMVMDIDNLYVGRACDSTQIDIGNITAPPSVCQGDAMRAGVFQRPIAPFMAYQWQYSTNNASTWSPLTGAEGNNYMLSQTNLTTTYRVIGTCTLTQKSDTTDTKLITAFTPQYAPLPYSQSFESWQTSSCNSNTSYINDVPDAYWLALPQSGSGSWRRNDQGNLGGWSSTGVPYTPVSSQGSYSARFNSGSPFPPIQGSFNLFVDMSGATDKTLAFDYINKTGTDSLRVSWSKDGGMSFSPIKTLSNANAWTQYSYSLTGGTAQTVIRFEGANLYDQYGNDDIGLDNLRIFANNFANDAAISSISPQSFGCQNTVQPMTVKLRNAGISPIDLAATPITVNVSVSGALSRSLTKTVNTGSLAVGALLDVVLDPSFTLSAVGIYNIDANLVSTADLNAVNNTLKTQIRVVSEKTIPFAEIFDASPNFPIGWVTEGGVRMDTSWRNNGNFRLGFYMASYFDPNLSTKGGSFTMPKMGVVRANDVLAFDAFIARYNEGLPSGVDWGNVEAAISDDCGQTWQTVWTANGTNFNSSLIASNIRIPLSNYVGKSIIVRFTAAYKSDSYFIWFDNFRVDTKCIGAPTIAPITGNATACYGEKVVLQTAVSSGVGLTWVWQKQDTASWVNMDTNKIQSTTQPLFLPTKYRVAAMCLTDSTTATSAPFNIAVSTPVYAQLPYRQDFETWQSCGTGNLQALPDASWTQQLYTGNGSWRRNDNGANAGWTNPTSGEYTPLSTKGSYSARFHTTQRSDVYPSFMDFYVDMSQMNGTKYIALDYNNGNSANGLYILFSKDSGKTFDNIDRLDQTNGWRRVEWALNTDSSQCILRFSGQGSPFSGNTSDIGIDNLTISNRPMPSCVEILTPSAWSSNVQSDVVFKWRSSTGAKGYKIKIGTTQNGSEFLPLTDVGQDTFFKPTQRLGFLTTYFITVIPFDSLGNARLCYPIQFSTQRNPNFGGGANGNDPDQPMSGGYFFANSTPVAAMALPSQPAYKWIAPLSNNHSEITTWTTGNSNNGSFTLPNIGFDFSFFGTIYRNNIFVNSNGALHFGAANTATGANEYIPNSSSPNNFLAACWMDLAAGTDGKVYYGTSPNGEYVVTWWHYHDVAPNGTTIDTAEYITFQAILNPNGTIKVQFNDSESTANNGRVFDILNDALIGIEDASGTMGIQYRNNGAPAPMFSSPLAIAFALNNRLLPTQNLPNTEGVSVGDVFPNPSSNLFSFDFYTPQKMALSLKLSNSLGQVVWSETLNTQIGKQQKTVDCAQLPSGVYWLTVATAQGQQFVQRVVKN